MANIADLVSYQLCPKLKYQECNNIFLWVMYFSTSLRIFLFFILFFLILQLKVFDKNFSLNLHLIISLTYSVQQQGSCFLGNIWDSLMVSYKVINVAWYLLWQLLCTLFNHLHHGLWIFFPSISLLPICLERMMHAENLINSFHFTFPLIFLFYKFNFISSFLHLFL